MSDLLKSSVECIVSFSSKMFPVLADQDEVDFSLFSSEEIACIKEKIATFQADPKSRSGGAFLVKELNYLHNFKASLFDKVANIKRELAPKEVHRQTLEDAVNKRDHEAINNLHLTLRRMEGKALRAFASAVLGEADMEYTVEELPEIVAVKQITGKLLRPGETRFNL